LARLRQAVDIGVAARVPGKPKPMNGK